MRKIYWLLLLLASFVVSVILNFNSSSFTVFLIRTFVIGALLFGFFRFAIKAVLAGKERKIGDTIAYSVLALLFILAFLGIFFLLAAGGVSPSETFAHFRTNIFTGKCDFGGYSSHRKSEPWYYKQGCNLTKEEKIGLIKISPDLERLRKACGYCSEVGIDSCIMAFGYNSQIKCSDVFG
ncbi:MAG: hypothetical protein V1659_02330 [Candidatus Woesearchaeota archaeon]